MGSIREYEEINKTARTKIICITVLLVMIIHSCHNNKVQIVDNRKTEIENTSLLDWTLLEETIVVNIDGEYQIVRMQEDIYHGKKNIHYYNIITGEETTESEKCENPSARKVGNVEIIGSISSYLTEEDLKKANNNELTDSDIIAILSRINEENKDTKSLDLKYEE